MQTQSELANITSFDFDDITKQEVPVKIQGKKYVLREATGDAVCKWRNSMMKSTRLSNDGKVTSMDGMADSEPLLVSLCLFELYEKVNGSQGERQVDVKTVRSWPARIQKSLFDKLKQMSQLDEKETKESLRKSIADSQKRLKEIEEAESNGHVEDEEKNELDATMGGLDSPPTSD